MNRQDTGKAVALAAVAVGGALAARGWRRSRGRYRFRDRTVLITGGSRGLGLVLARRLAREKARLVLVARDPEELRVAELELQQDTEVLSVPCDISVQAQVERAVAAARERFGRVDVLINNAGIISVGPLEVQSVEDFERAMGVHFWGPLYATLAVLPDMRERGEGRIVNISSIGGKISVPHLLPYCASKFALVGLSEGLNAELAGQGITVTTVCPGLMRTGSPRNALFKGDREAEYTWFAVADSLPGLSVHAERAAAEILDACRNGDAELVISLPAAAAVAFHGVFPGLTAELLAAANRLLPPPEGSRDAEATPGKLHETPITRSWLTALTQKAASANNES